MPASMRLLATVGWGALWMHSSWNFRICFFPIRRCHTCVWSYVNKALGLCSQPPERTIQQFPGRRSGPRLRLARCGCPPGGGPPRACGLCVSALAPPGYAALSAANCDLSRWLHNLTRNVGRLRRKVKCAALIPW